MIELTVNGYLVDVAKETDRQVRVEAAKFLVDLLLSCSSSKCLDILMCFDKVCCREVFMKCVIQIDSLLMCKELHGQ